MELIGYLFLCFVNAYFSLLVAVNFTNGGGDLGPLLTGWVHWKWKVWGIILLLFNIYLWYLLYTVSPLTIGLK